MTEAIDIAVCAECIDDDYLKEIVLEEGEVRECNLCGENDRPAFTPEDLGKLLEPLLRERLALGGDMRVFGGPDDEKGHFEQQGDPLEYFVAEALAQDFDFLDDIVQAVIDAEDVWPPDGEEAFFEDYYNYEPRGIYVYEMLEEWQLVQDELRTSRRFFNEAAKSFFASLFADIDTLLTPVVNIDSAMAAIAGDETDPILDADDTDDDTVVRTLPEGTDVYRARACRSQEMPQKTAEQPYQQVGPPPSDKARAGRMNAEGIVVLYGALSVETAVAEMRPPLGGDTVTIMLRATRSLRVLDFKRLESAYSTDDLSYFQPDFDHLLEKHAFLQQLHQLIARPVLPGKEDEYLITQTMAEYLNHVHAPPFDGILFDSVQQQGGTNIVLFASTIGEFPVEYVDGTLRVFRTESINYQHSEGHMFERGDNARVVGFAMPGDEF